MPDCFISYSSTDEELARFVELHLRAQGLNVFLASVSLQPGQRWSEQIWANLGASPWVVFLASKAACQSAYVQQELGAALAFEKRVIPIVWDLAPSELPGWIRERQAIDLRGGTWDDLALAVQGLANAIMADKRNGALLVGAIFFGLLWLSSQGK
jgi:hypothetical protein